MEGLREPLKRFDLRSRLHSLSPYGRQWILRELRLQDRDQRAAACRRWRRVAPMPDGRTRVAALVFLGLPTALVLVGCIVGLPLASQVILSFIISLVNATLLLRARQKNSVEEVR